MKGREIPPQETTDGKKELYHGTKKVFDNFKTPAGIEEMDVMEGDFICAIFSSRIGCNI